MSYELALKKAGIPLIRCFIQSVEAVAPYFITNVVVFQFKLKSATTFLSNSKPTPMAKFSRQSVN